MSVSTVTFANKIKEGNELELHDALSLEPDVEIPGLDKNSINEGDYAKVLGTSFRKNGRTRLRLGFRNVEFNLTYLDDIELLVKV